MMGLASWRQLSRALAMFAEERRRGRARGERFREWFPAAWMNFLSMLNLD